MACPGTQPQVRLLALPPDNYGCLSLSRDEGKHCTQLPLQCHWCCGESGSTYNFYFIFHCSPTLLTPCSTHTQPQHFPNMPTIFIIPCFCSCKGLVPSPNDTLAFKPSPNVTLSAKAAPNFSLKKKGKMLVAQLCPTLCDPMDCSPPGSSAMEFSRQKYWSGLTFPSPGNLP